MKELIDARQAQFLMLAVLAAAPIFGLLWGVVVKRVKFGFLVGLAIGVGNFALWTLYNAVTARLGLDTVKNLLVNLTLFLVLGVMIGFLAGRFSSRRPPAKIDSND